MYDPKKDAQFSQPFIDSDELKERAGISFRYVHGGFSGSPVRFSFCFPSPETFRGRFYQFLSPFPGPTEELASLSPERSGTSDQIVFALSHGAYFVESNMGSVAAFGPSNDGTLIFRSSAAVAEYSREIAREYYGSSRPYGYVYGGSGGGYKTVSCIENTSAFDGAVPFVTACPVALPSMLTVFAHARRLLRHKLPEMVDAIEPGSDHDVWSILNDEEKDALHEILRMGMPMEGLLQFPYADDGSLTVLAPAVKIIDPAYFEEFWTQPGYLGTEPDSSAVRDRVRFKASIRDVFLPSALDVEQDRSQKAQAEIDRRNGVNNAWQKMLMDSRADGKPWIELDRLPANGLPYIGGVSISFLTGAAAGSSLRLAAVEGSRLMIGTGYGSGLIEDVLVKARSGDEVLLDNSDYLAIQTYHRHQVPDPEYLAWNQFRDADGQPLYPQRPLLLGPSFAMQGAGSIQSGRIQGKVILMNCLADGGAATWMSDWYRGKVRDYLGTVADDHFRLWCMEHCGHDDAAAVYDELHVCSYLGALYQALLDVSDWVERGVQPAETSGYTIIDGQPHIPADAGIRHGIQPVVHLTANGCKRAEVSAGEAVIFTAMAELPAGSGSLTRIEWSFDGESPVSTSDNISWGEDRVSATITAEYAYSEPGDHFAVIRVWSERNGDADSIFTQVQNIDRVRVVVRSRLC